MLFIYFFFGLGKEFSGSPSFSSSCFPMSGCCSLGIHSFRGAPVPFFTSSAFSSTALREALVERCLPPAGLGFDLSLVYQLW